MAEKYTCRIGTRKWPILSLQSTLNLAATNVWILYFCKDFTNQNISLKDFIGALPEELAEPQVQKRNGVPDRASFAISNEDERQPKKFVK